MSEMPEKIYAGIYHDDAEYPKYEWRNRKMTGTDKYIRHDLYEALEAENQRLVHLLAGAQNGLKWYQDEHPEDASEADAELHAQIDEALAQRIGGSDE